MDEQKFQEENARHGLSLLNLKRVQAPRREPDAESGAWRSLNFEQDRGPGWRLRRQAYGRSPSARSAEAPSPFTPASTN